MQNIYLKTIILILLSLDIYAYNSDTYSDLISKKTKEAQDIFLIDSDLALKTLDDISSIVSKTDDQKSIINYHLLKSKIYTIQQNYPLAFDSAVDAVFNAEEYNDLTLLAESYSIFGKLHAEFHERADAENYLMKSIAISKKLLSKNLISNQKLISRYLTVVQSYRKLDDYDFAKKYLDTCYFVAKNSTTKTKYLNVEKGIILFEQKDYNNAIATLQKSVETFKNIDENQDFRNEKGYLSVIYSYIGDCYRLVYQNETAVAYFEKALNQLNSNSRYNNHLATILEKKALLLFQIGKHDEAFLLLQKSHEINDKYYSSKSLSKGGFFKIRNKYLEGIKNKNIELENRENQLSKFRLTLYIIGILFLLIILTAALIYQNKKHKQEKLAIQEKQKENTTLLKIKNKELTESTLKIIEKETQIEKLKSHLKAQPLTPKTTSLLKSIGINNQGLWEDFNNRFVAVNNDFYEKLKIRFPELSPNELKICALIKLNFSTKEMAHLLGISLPGVNKARYRLRKKINIDRDVNLTTFISSI